MKTRDDLEKELAFLQRELPKMIDHMYNDSDDDASRMFHMEFYRQQCQKISERIAEIEWTLTATEKDRT